MKTMRTGVHVALAVAGGMAGAIALPASAGTINFEDQTTGPRSSLSTTVDGVTAAFTRTSGINFGIDNLSSSSGPASWGSRTLSPFNSPTTNDAFNVNFTGTVRGISIEFGDYGFDAGLAQFRAYSGPDGTGSLLNSQSLVWDGNLALGALGSLSFASATPIGSIRFWGEEGLGGFPNSLYWDNLGFTADAQIIPLPTASAMGLGGLGLLSWRRRRAL